MKILVINAGSSSFKYQLIDMTDESVIAKGLCERIGSAGNIKHTAADGRVYKADYPMPTHMEAFDCLIYALTKSEAKVIDSLDEINAVGHRVVQGGDFYSKSVVINEDVLKTVESFNDLAPLHNPANLMGVRACIKAFGENVPQVAVFDTSFHQTMPPRAFMYGIPYEYYEKYGVRRYGFHGASHRFVSERCAEIMGKAKEDLKIITCHLGNGCSIAAVDGGKSIDTSMGFTPLDGFMMGTRSGTLDPSIITFIAEKENLSPAEISNMLNKQSGMLGISGVSNDNRDITAAANEGNERAKLAFEMQRYQIVKFVGSYIAAMNGVDAIVFTGGIGENDSAVRKYVMDSLTYMGVYCGDANADIHGSEGLVSTPDSKVPVYVIPTNEELVIARDALALTK